MNSLPIIVGLVIGIAVASLIFAIAFTLLCVVILAGLKALPMRNPFANSNSNGGRSEPRLACLGKQPKACRRFSLQVQRGNLIRLGRVGL